MGEYCNFADNQLALLLKKGDRTAYTEIYERYKGLLYVHAYRILQDREETQDILQELFLALWAKRETLNFSTGLASYLYAAVRNRVFDRIAREKVVSSYFESLRNFAPGFEPGADELLEEKELAALIEKEINALPVKMRKVFQLSREAQMSHREIADHLVISDKTVKKQVSNALRILRLKLGAFFLLLLLLPLALLTVIS